MAKQRDRVCRGRPHRWKHADMSAKATSERGEMTTHSSQTSMSKVGIGRLTHFYQPTSRLLSIGAAEFPNLVSYSRFVQYEKRSLGGLDRFIFRHTSGPAAVCLSWILHVCASATTLTDFIASRLCGTGGTFKDFYGVVLRF